MKRKKTVEKEFDDLWKETKSVSFLGGIIFYISERAAMKSIGFISRKSKVVDVGCATGRTLLLFRKYGFSDSIGIDISKESLKICNSEGLETGKDVFLMDAKRMKFKKRSFDLVFAEGLLEHFENFQPFVDEMCRISKKYVMVIQPNAFSYWHHIENFYWKFFPRDHVEQLAYSLDDFNKAFMKNNFKLKKVKNLILNSGWSILYERKK
ncbi:MAG: class I SAM-dependent methyltransferase [Candidatus Aenigmatarchaeota archaeon]